MMDEKDKQITYLLDMYETQKKLVELEKNALEEYKKDLDFIRIISK